MTLQRIETAPKSCSVEDCGSSRYCRGYCVMHYNRWRRHGDAGDATRNRAPWGSGSITDEGYRVLHLSGHPLAGRQGKVLEHRVVLYQAIGVGPHACHWCVRDLTWQGRPESRICADHLDANRLNNHPSNLVPSCLDCNTKRAAA